MVGRKPSVKIIIATHKKYEMPKDDMYLPLHVGAEGKVDENNRPLDTIPKNTTIGKCTDDDSELMYPNTNFLKFFPAEEMPETKGSAYRSGCLRAGPYFVLRKIIAEYRLDEMLGDIIGKNSGLFLDLAVN